MSLKKEENNNKIMYKEVEKLIIYGKDTQENVNQIMKMIAEMDEPYSNDIGDNLLMISARKSMNLISKTIFNYFIEKGNYKEIKHINEDLENVLMIFVKRNNIDLFKEIVKNENLKSMLEQKNKYGKTIFSFIKDYGRTEMLEILEKNNMSQNTLQKQKLI